MAFIARRFVSSTTRLYTAVSTPAPVHRIAVLGTPELQSLSKKSQGSWKELSKEEKITCKLVLLACCPYHLALICIVLLVYRAAFPQTFKEANNPPNETVKVLLGVSVSIVIGYFLAGFLRDSSRCGPNSCSI